MGRHILVVLSSPVEGREDEYNEWYSNVHLREVVEIPGFVSAQRFKLADAQLIGILSEQEKGSRAYGESDHRYLAIYEMEAESAEIALQTFREARPKLNMSDALASALSVWTFSPITGIVRAP